MLNVVVKCLVLLGLILSSTLIAIPGPGGGNPPNAPNLVVPATDADGNYTVSYFATGATSYTLYENGSSIYTGTASSRNITGKSPGTYTYYARACNGYGCTNSVSKSVVVGSSAPTVTSSYTAGQASFTVNWTTPSGTTYFKYSYHAEGDNWGSPVTTTSTSKVYTSVLPGNHYFRVQACTSSSCGSYSSIHIVNVTEPTPCP